MIYEKEPKDFSKEFEVTVAKILLKDKFLFVQRSKNEEYSGTWSLPGGKVEENETKEQTIKRELNEELCLDVIPIFFKTLFVRYPNKDFLYHMFTLKIEKTPKIILNTEHSDYKWLKIEDALKLNLIPGEEECLKKFQ